MASFTDCNGQSWRMEIVFADRADLKRLGVDLDTPGDSQFAEVIYENPVALVEVLWFLAKRHAGERTRDDFERGLDAAALDRAGDALIESIVDFIHRRRSAAVIAQMPGLLAAVDKAHEKAVTAAADLALKKVAGDSPESSASTPAP